MTFKCQNELIPVSKELTRLLEDRGISAEVGEDAFRDYAVKVSISKDGKPSGNVNLYYSPRRDSYSLRTHGLKDKSVVPELEKSWQQLFPESGDPARQRHQIYVDGSFLNGTVGYGTVILEDDDVVEELSGVVPEELVQGTRQVAGELFAVQEAIQWCQANSVEEVAIFYDYKGIEKWASGEWKAKQPLTQRYAEFVRNCGIHIEWHKVDSHTGNRWNERADELAKRGAGSPSPGPDAASGLAAGLETKAEEFIQFLRDRGYEAKLRGVYDSSACAKIEVSEANRDLGFVNIYRTRKAPFLPRYHELRDESYADKLDSLWQEFCNGPSLF